MACGAMTVPLAIDSLGVQEFGVWLTISSVVTMLGFLDLGLGNGLVTELAVASGQDDFQRVRRAISSAFLGLTVVGTLVLSVGIILAWQLDWQMLGLANSYRSNSELQWGISFVALGLAIAIPSSVAMRVQQGMQEAYYSALWITFGAAAQLGGVLVCHWLDTSLRWFILAFVGGPTLGALGNVLFYLFLGRRSCLRPARRCIEADAIWRLSRMGLPFFLLGIAGAAAYQSDALVIASRMNTTDVAEYGVAYRLYAVIPVLTGFFLLPLWPAYGEALARRDLDWVRRTIRRSIVVSVSVNVASALLLLVVGRRVIELWVGPSIDPPLLLLIALALLGVSSGITGPLAMALNGTNQLWFQVKCASAMLIANLGLSWVLVDRLGTPGPVFGTVVTQALFVLIPGGLFLRRHLWDSSHTIATL